MLRTPFTELVGCSVPLQQAGMGWIAGPELAAAVANAGGLGMVAMPMLPLRPSKTCWSPSGLRPQALLA